MIEKFNFYDVYGYFLPGAALLLLLWIPNGLVRNSWPTADLGSAVIGVVAAYIIGHLLQMACGKVIPSSTAKGADGRDRYPSAVVLDPGDGALPADFQKNLADAVEKKFGLDLQVGQPGTREIDRVRDSAFLLARHALVQTKQISYGEQFQGLYSLLRGLGAAFALAGVYYIGWSVSALHRPWLDCLVIVIITVSLLAATNLAAHLLKLGLKVGTAAKLERWSALFLLFATLSAGYGTGRRFEITPLHAGELALCAIAALMACLRSLRIYKYHCTNFALTVWRDFFASIQAPGNTGKP